MFTQIEVTPTPEQLAVEFWYSFSEEQARFFNHLATLSDSGKFQWQMNNVALTKELTPEGARVMRQIGLAIQ